MSVAKKPTLKSDKKKVAKKVVTKKVITKKAAKNSLPQKPKATKKTKTPVSKKKDTAGTVRIKKTIQTKKTATKKTTSAIPSKIENDVAVPTNIPLRSIEKAAVLRSELSLSWQQSVHRIAYVSGFCFLLIGATLASTSVFEAGAGVKNNALISTAATDLPVSHLSLQSTVPKIVKSTTEVSFSLTDALEGSVQYYLVNQDTKKTSESKRVKSHVKNQYSFLLNPADIRPGDYQLYINYSNQNSNEVVPSKKTEAVAEFRIPAETAAEMTSVSSLDSGVEPQSLNTPGSADELLPHEVSSSSRTVTPTTDTPIEKEKPEIQKTLETQEKPLVETSKTTDKILSTSEFSIYTKESVISGVLILNSVNADGFRNLELYARPVTSLNSRFLTRASERSGTKTFVVNTESFLPNGKYEFYARGTDASGKELITPSLVLTIKNISSEIKPVDSFNRDSEIQKSETEKPTAVPVQKRTFAPTDLDSTARNTNEKNSITQGSERLLREDAENITLILQNYASARQSGDEILIKAARESLTKKKVELANSALIDRKLAGISDDVILDISEKLANLQNRIDTFEQIRKEKSAGESAVDTDGDGISDYDEVNLYGTDPNEPDTDGDGFPDGIEIIRGFDPLSDIAEAVIEFESPKESFGLVRANEFIVLEVVPVTNSIAGAEDDRLLTEIRGRGLPNSFVTLYIFSSPTIVTIKTDADGSFVYTLDKELEDGNHDIFVALTDNTGSIVAQSNPFSFIKEARAFTPVDAAEGNLTAESIAQTTARNSYNTVIGLGVLAFGLILIMLGLSLRTRKDEAVIALSRTGEAKPTDPTDAKTTNQTS